MRYECAVDWPNVSVGAGYGSLVLRQNIEPLPDDHWRRAFAEVRGKVRWTTHGRSSSDELAAPAGVHVEDLKGGSFTVGFLPGTEDELRSFLDEFFAAVNERAGAFSDAAEADAKQKSETAAELGQAASLAEQRLRSS